MTVGPLEDIKLRIKELGDIFHVLNSEGVVTEKTCQQLAFAPADGLYCVVGRSG